MRFSYIPSLASISPTSGPTAGGTVVTITGAGFDIVAGHTKFKFGGVLASNVTCSTSTSCTAVTPAHTAGFVRVVTIVDGVRSSSFVGFRYR